MKDNKPKAEREAFHDWFNSQSAFDDDFEASLEAWKAAIAWQKSQHEVDYKALFAAHPARKKSQQAVVSPTGWREEAMGILREIVNQQGFSCDCGIAEYVFERAIAIVRETPTGGDGI